MTMIPDAKDLRATPNEVAPAQAGVKIRRASESGLTAIDIEHPAPGLMARLIQRGYTVNSHRDGKTITVSW